MLHLLIITLLISTNVDARLKQRREATKPLCDDAYNTTNGVQCSCVKDRKEPDIIRSADCFLTTADVGEKDDIWNDFTQINTINKLVLTNFRRIDFTYVPVKAINHLKSINRIDVKYGQIDAISAHTFANISSLTEVTLADNHIKTLHKHSFVNLEKLMTINLDKNEITEINRDIFTKLPALKNLFMSRNNISTIHDKAFIHLHHLKELDLSRNRIFSLNTETFSGLRSLERLELSYNAIEVIGDNTFSHLSKLVFLNLENNTIQMLDDRAFHGLSKLTDLSLAMNKLTSLDSPKLFEHLDSLKSLSVRGNKLKEIRADVIRPILTNFYGTSNKLDFDDNVFSCDCKLEWFMALRTKTLNENLKQSLENLKCIPDEALSEKWKKIEENDKNTGKEFEEEDTQNGGDYEYYDASQLNGKLFYTDIRELIDCIDVTNPETFIPTRINPITSSTERETNSEPETSSSLISTSTPYVTTKRTEKTTPTTEVVQTKTMKKIETSRTTERLEETSKQEVKNQGVLDLSIYDSTTQETEQTDHADMKDLKEDITTTRLATVSAKPVDNINEDDKMASDEAVPDSVPHTSLRDEVNQKGNANNNVLSIVPIILLTVALRL